MKRSSRVAVVTVVAFLGGCGLPASGLKLADDGGSPATDATTSGGDAPTNDETAVDALSVMDGAGGVIDGSGFDGPEGGEDAHDAESGAPDAGGAGDARPDSVSPCATPLATACVDPLNGGNGLCSNGSACTGCKDPRDDSSCATAYGASSVPFLCLSGDCVPGDCRTAADCALNSKGPLCGSKTAHLCGPCTTDAQCASALPGAPTCNPATGQCVVGACTSGASNPPLPCQVNASDVCCAGRCRAGGSASCCPGPDANAYCATLLNRPKAACGNGLCSVCPPASGGVYMVDPANGSDQTGTGAVGTPGCALQTIAAALQLVGNAAVATTIVVVGPSIVGPGETFPITLPKNVRIGTSSGAVRVEVPAGVRGFFLASESSGLAGGLGAPLTLAGGGAGTNGIVAATGSGLTTRIAEVSVTGFAGNGILVEGSGVLSIGPGVNSTANGTSNAVASGLRVTGDGHAEIGVAAGEHPTHFDSNTNHGILVEGNASVTVSGVVTSPLTGTVTTSTNNNAGLWIAQTSTSPPQNVITGLVSFGSVSANGMRLFAGSNVKMRDSVSLGNAITGMLVAETANSTDLSLIDLGNSAGPDYGRNVFQASGTAQNRGSGLCLEVSGGGDVLLAAGNVFSTARCDVTSAVLTLDNGSCTDMCSNGGPCDLGIVFPGAADVDVSMCTHP